MAPHRLVSNSLSFFFPVVASAQQVPSAPHTLLHIFITMFSLKTILFAATAALSGVASAVPIAPAEADAYLNACAPSPHGTGGAGGGYVYSGSDLLIRSPYGPYSSGSAATIVQARSPVILLDTDAGGLAGAHLLTERDACNSCGSIPGILAYVNVQLDGILTHVRKWPAIPGMFLGELAH